MNSKTTDEFRKAFGNLPKEIQAKSKSKFKLWKDNPNHQSLRFKQIHNSKPIYSIRISIGYRALGFRWMIQLFGFGLARIPIMINY